jgi:hypothetical protein
MFMRRRRPLLRGAMIGGTAYAVGRHSQRASAERDDQEQRLEDVEANQQAQSTPAAAPAPSTDLVSRLKELSGLKDSGALTQEEFDAAKAKLLAS